MGKERPGLGQNKGRNTWWMVLVASVLAVCAFAVYRGSSQLIQVQEELAQVRKTNQNLDQENRTLYRQVQRLRNDNQALEKVCRQEMNLVRPDEVVYQTSGKDAKPKTPEKVP